MKRVELNLTKQDKGILYEILLNNENTDVADPLSRIIQDKHTNEDLLFVDDEIMERKGFDIEEVLDIDYILGDAINEINAKMKENEPEEPKSKSGYIFNNTHDTTDTYNYRYVKPKNNPKKDTDNSSDKDGFEGFEFLT